MGLNPLCESIKMQLVNDMQAQLNETMVTDIVDVSEIEHIVSSLNAAKASGTSISIAGGRHAMGGQQYGRDTRLIDMRGFSGVSSFDREKGLVEVESGIMWPRLIDFLHREQMHDKNPWAIRQKQTGVDSVTIGGSLAANIHGRGLTFPPFVSDIESFNLIDTNGRLLTCSRKENVELFSLAVGGYGLFGVVTHVTLRLVPRTKVKRLVEVIAVRNLLSRVDEMIQEGFTYGDCQYSINLGSDEEFHPGVFSCYKPIDPHTPMPAEQKHLSGSEWAALYRLARTDKQKAFETYSHYYLSTSGQVYWSDNSVQLLS